MKRSSNVFNAMSREDLHKSSYVGGFLIVAVLRSCKFLKIFLSKTSLVLQDSRPKCQGRLKADGRWLARGNISLSTSLAMLATTGTQSRLAIMVETTENVVVLMCQESIGAGCEHDPRSIEKTMQDLTEHNFHDCEFVAVKVDSFTVSCWLHGQLPVIIRRE